MSRPFFERHRRRSSPRRFAAEFADAAVLRSAIRLVMAHAARAPLSRFFACALAQVVVVQCGEAAVRVQRAAAGVRGSVKEDDLPSVRSKEKRCVVSPSAARHA